MSDVNLHSTLEFWAVRWPDRPAIKCGYDSITWGDLDRRSSEIAAGLVQSGVAKGDRIGILMHNRIDFIVTLYAVLKSGASLVLLNVRFTPKEMAYPLTDAGIKVVISESAFQDVLQDTIQEVPDVDVYMIDQTSQFRSYNDLCVVGGKVSNLSIGRDDVALVCYTSGTTGFPKGAMLTHGSIRESGLAGIVSMGITFEDRLMISLPLAYTWGTCQYLREALISGATTILEASFDADHLMDVIEREKITIWASVVVLFEKIANSPRFSGAGLSSLKHAITGNASRHLLKTWRSIGVPITQAYGLTETGGHATILYSEDAETKMGSSGRAVMHSDIKVVDENGKTVAPGQAGEVLIKGPIVMKGYLNKPEETAKTMDGDWLKTGDIGYMDEGGYLSLVDRSKDMLKSGGLNVYPAELERIIAGITGLEEFAIIGVADEQWGEVPMIIYHGTQKLDLAGLKDRIQSDLADFKRPKYVVDYGKPLPRTVSGKILKRDLRLEFKAAPKTAVLLKDSKTAPKVKQTA